MTSIPQLQADLAAMQGKLREALSRIEWFEAQEPKVIEKPVPMPQEVKIEYRDRVVEVPGPERVVTVERIVEVPGPERIIRDEAAITAAQAEIADLKAKLAAEKRKKRQVEVKTEIVKVPVEVDVIKYKDNPASGKEIKRLTDELTKFQLELAAERKKKTVIEYRDRVIEKPVPMPVETKIEYRDRIVEVPGPERVVYIDRPQEKPSQTVKYVAMPPEKEIKYIDRTIETVKYVDNPALIETIKKLQSQLKGK